MTLGLLMLFLAQTPAPAASAPIAVVVSSKRPGAEVYSPGIAARVYAALLREGVPVADALDDLAAGKKVKAAGFSDARNCQGGASCLVKLAVLLGPHAVVVGVDVGKISNQLALRLDAVSAETGKSLLVTDVTAPAETFGDKAAVPIALFARQLVGLAKQAAPPPTIVKAEPVVIAPPVADAPRVSNLTPPPTPPPLEVKAGRAPAALKWSLGIGAVVAAGVSVGFLAAGLGTRAEMNSQRTTTPSGMVATRLTAAQVDALSQRSNSQLTISLVTGIVTAVLAGTATWFFATE
jgi:hypothetical protein